MQNQNHSNVSLSNFKVKHNSSLLSGLQRANVQDTTTHPSTSQHKSFVVHPKLLSRVNQNLTSESRNNNNVKEQNILPRPQQTTKTLIFHTSGNTAYTKAKILTSVNNLGSAKLASVAARPYATSLVLNTRVGSTLPQNVITNSTGAFVPLNQLIVSKPLNSVILKSKVTSNNQSQMPQKSGSVTIPVKTTFGGSGTIKSIKIAQPNLNNSLKLKAETANFDWEEYLKLTSQTAAPLKCFKHVLSSQSTGFLPGMKLEVDNSTVPNTYWVATVIETRGKFLKLRYDGFGNNSSDDFSVNIKTGNLHPIGWCAQNAKILQPPQKIKNQHTNWAEFLVKTLIGARTVPSHLLMLPNKGKTVVELIEKGMLLEIQDAQHPQHVWIAHVEQNVGGRLLLRYEGMTDQDSRQDFWLFYLNIRLHPLGWGKDHGLTMKPPDHIRKKYPTGEQWALKLSQSLKGITERELVSSYVFQDQVKLKEHGINVPGKLAVLDPVYPTKIRPATVVNIISKHFFLAQLDQSEKACLNHAFLCHSTSSGIFSIDWCKKNKIPITLPNGETISGFNWDYYLQKSGISALPASCFEISENHSFKSGMMLEAGNPFNLQEICLARVIAVHSGIIRLQLNNALECFVPASSHDIFPVGWCKANKYPLSSIKMWSPMADKSANVTTNAIESPQPFVTTTLSNKIPLTSPETKCLNPIKKDPTTDNLINFVNPKESSDLWCPAIYFNCSCNIGTVLNSINLSKVPRKVGPGNIILVLKEVLSLLVGAANNPIKLLKEFESLSNDGESCQECDLKAKYNGKKYKTSVSITDKSTSVPRFLKAITSILKCCPNLLTVNKTLTNCSLKCKQILAEQTKFNRNNIILKRKKNLQKMRMAKIIKRRFQSTGSNLLNSSDFNSNTTFREINVSNHKPIHKPHLNIENDHSLIKSNPFYWTMEDVVDYVKATECRALAGIFKQQEIDGQAFLLLTLPLVQDCMNLKLGPALKLCRVIENVKLKFYEKYAN